MATSARLAMLVAGALLGAAPASASSPCPREAICQEFWAARAVFVGRVVAVGPEPGYRTGVLWVGTGVRTGRIEVLEAFRGPEAVRAGAVVEAVFGHELGVGGRFFFYAVQSTDGRLQVASCGHVKTVAEADEDLRYARGLATDRSTEARVFGDVTWAEGTSTAPPRDPADRLPRVAWIAAAGGTERRFESDADGHIEARLPPGRYTVRVEAPAEFTADRTWELEIADARACRRIDVALDRHDSVSGRIVDAEGRPVPGLRVHMVTGFPGAWHSSGLYTDAAGGFRFSDLGAGDHDLYVGANILATSIERKVRLPRGEHQVLDPITLPADTRLASIAGTVVDDRGLPMEGALVELAQEDVPFLGHLSTGADGRYRFTAVPGRAYRIEATMPLPPPDYRGDTAQSEPIEAGAGAGPKPIVLRRPGTP